MEGPGHPAKRMWGGAAGLPEQVCGATVTMGLGIHVHMPRHMPKETHTQVHTQADTSGSAGTCMHLGEAPPPTKTEEQPQCIQHTRTNPYTIQAHT